MNRSLRGHVEADAVELPREALQELRLMIDTYERLSAERMLAGEEPRIGSDSAIAIIADRLTNEPRTIWWSDMAEAEQCIADLIADRAVPDYLNTWRRRYREVVGQTRYDLYLSTAPKIDDKETTFSRLRDDLAGRIRAVYFYYSSRGVSAAARGKITLRLLLTGVVILLIEGLISAVLYQGFHGAVAGHYVLAASAAALLGAIISVQRRLQNPRISVDPFYKYIQLSSDPWSIVVVSPLFGAVFGTIVYGFFASGLVSAGSIVPSFTDGIPQGGAAIALTLIYAFIGGFSERFVPDTLDKLAEHAIPVAAALSPSTTPGSDGTVAQTVNVLSE